MAHACRMKLMYNHVNPKNDQPSPLIAEDVYKIIMEVRGSGVCTGRCKACSAQLGFGCGVVMLAPLQCRCTWVCRMARSWTA